MANTLTHISLLVEDVQKALHFYKENLGLEVIENLGNYTTLKANENLKLSFFPRTAMQEALPSTEKIRNYSGPFSLCRLRSS